MTKTQLHKTQSSVYTLRTYAAVFDGCRDYICTADGSICIGRYIYKQLQPEIIINIPDSELIYRLSDRFHLVVQEAGNHAHHQNFAL